jgi:hypothetical protein
MLLAHKVNENPEEWSDAILDMRERSDDRKYKPVVILDNGMYELGGSLSPKELADACDAVSAEYMLLPDVMDDGQKTVELSLKAVEEFGGIPPADKFAFVAQGRTEGEYIQSILDFLTQVEFLTVGMICVPKKAYENLKTRQTLVNRIADEIPELPIHLLGLSISPMDDVYAANHSRVIGIDSATPVWWGSLGQLVTEGVPSSLEIGKRPYNFWSLSLMNSMYMSYNINYVKSWFGDVEV